MIDQQLYSYMEGQLALTSEYFYRYLYQKIAWNDRMIGIVGPRGVGKTTMVLQYIKQHKQDIKALYISADIAYFTTHTLIEVADEWSKEDGKLLVIDEVHKYPEWSRELKQIYDTHPDMQIIFTGSSILDIQKGSSDLSRRALIYTLQGLSFREYLYLFHNIDTPIFSLEDILAGKAYINQLLHPLSYFREYLKSGYYPFATNGNFEVRMQNIVIQTIETDIATYANLKTTTARKLRKMLTVVASLAPFKPNADTLATTLSVSRNNISDYLILLEQAQMIGQLRDDTQGIRGLGKVEKVYLDNPNLMYVLNGGNIDTGNLRETFFYNQMRVNHDVTSSRIADFAINEYTFEVGGRNKSQKQLGNTTHGFVVKDDIEFAQGNIIPLWAFGLNY
jgi:predicted AAA+ superfamily ATPase